MSLRRPIRERFNEKWMPEPFSGCWLWTASWDTLGYGSIVESVTNHIQRAHRVSWELHRGPIPTGLCVLHKCDTPACVNPDHLFLGTHQENMTDRNKKGRARGPRGEDHGMSKLTTDIVIEIIHSTERGEDLARRLGLGKTTVNRIRRGGSWKHVYASIK